MRELTAHIPDESLHACVTDPPYELGFMEAGWDKSGVAFSVDTWRAVYRVLKPGAHLVAFGGPRTAHRMTCAIEDAGFEIRDGLQWLYGCLSEDTELLTAEGWIPYHKAIEGNHALGYNVDTQTYEWMPIEQVFVYDYSDTAYRLRSDSTEQIVSRNHRCLVERSGAFTFQFAETLKRWESVPVLENLSGLLKALPLPHAGTGRAEQSLRAGLCCRTDSPRPNQRSAPTRYASCRSGLRRLRDRCTEATGQGIGCADVFPTMQRETTWGRMGEARAEGSRGLDAGKQCGVQSPYEWPDKSSLEGRRHGATVARKPRRGRLRPLSCGVPTNGTKGRVRNGTSACCRADVGAMPYPSGSRTPSKPPKPGQPRRKLDAVQQQQRPQTVRGDRFTRADMVSVTPFHYVGKVWCIQVRSGAFVARRNGKVFVTGNSGFPKSLNISQAIDRRRDDYDDACRVAVWLRPHIARVGFATVSAHFGFKDETMVRARWTTNSQPHVPRWEQWLALKALCGFGDDLDAEVWRLNGRKGQPGEAYHERPVVGERELTDSTKVRLGFAGETYNDAEVVGARRVVAVTTAATEAAQAWEGWGTNLKPGHEPICLARKPFPGTVAENILRHGCGGLNIDACRIGSSSTPRRDPRNGNLTNAHMEMRPWMRERIEDGLPLKGDFDGAQGRWPPNVLLDPAAAAWLDEQSGTSISSGGTGQSSKQKDERHGWTPSNTGGFGDIGGASRFFPVFDYADEDYLSFLYTAKAPQSERHAGTERGNDHPTVKPVTVMRWLCRLITPPGGTILDPFFGSGTTGVAARRESFYVVGIELREEAATVAQSRCAAAEPTIEGEILRRTLTGRPRRAKSVPAGQEAFDL